VTRPGLIKKEDRNLRRCAKDFLYFCRYLKIVDKKARLVEFRPNDAQKRLFEAIKNNPWVYDLKARQLGGTTGVAALAFWHALTRPNFRVGVMAQSREGAEQIFEIYKRFYDNLPDWLRFPTEKSNVREMMFFHGGMIRVFTANSQSARGTTYNFLHCSEFAFYSDVEKTIQSAFQTATPDAIVVMETTANGMGHAHDLWHDKNGYTKLFMPWTLAEEYALPKSPSVLKGKKIPARWGEYRKEHGLTKQQLWWAYNTFSTKCGRNWNTFHQEYPVTAELAFITSGERFFDCIFPHVRAVAGYRQYAEPQKYHIYAMGVDTASGSPSGDYSTWCVLDITDKLKPVCVSTFYGRLSPSEFGARVLKEAKRFDALVCPEANTYGLSIIEYLIEKSYANLYRRTKFDKMANRWREELGFVTTVATRPVLLSRLHRFISDKSLAINDDRMKAEINTFIYNAKGKPEAERGRHDDMVFAWALALAAIDQIDVVRDDVMSKRPDSITDLLAFEQATGTLYRDTWGRSDTDTLDVLSHPQFMPKGSPAKIPGR